ncbi:hypothetical protein TpMuguga_04g00103 [Theileria parva strain Muguga]|uniref:SfiI-subtelomeric related protein family member n=1 Tax=Theileria parva TaxID=5875 RepID=Q4N384_THEPA|nr:uncharacterized protein TpMuguga_04g00103 [Theileria parva strain Muguga]EAN31455.1 hypothetical protein TpMuguga_04g00103 [Theileria parva strain Muguga]|eukprot:XP_763738.1 hypothetical protein [Theileria parva strain Muguga]
MKFEILIFIAVLGSCPYKSVYGVDGNASSQSTGATTGQTSVTPQSTTPASGTTPAAKTGATTDNTGLTLDIKKTSSTTEFEYSKDGEFKTYTPKSGHTISKIVKGNNDIWTATDNDHAVKVARKGSGSCKKHIAILLKSSKFILLQKEGKKKPWKDVTGERYDITKLKFYGDDAELKVTDYKIDLLGRDKTFAFVYEFTGANCKKIKFGDEDIWKSTDDRKYSTIKKFSLGLVSNDFFVRKSENEFKKLELNLSTTPGSGTTTTPGQDCTGTPATGQGGSSPSN